MILLPAFAIPDDRLKCSGIYQGKMCRVTDKETEDKKTRRTPDNTESMMTYKEKPGILTSWGPIASTYKALTRKRFVREQVHKTGWIMAGMIIALTLFDIIIAHFLWVRFYAQIFIISLVILSVSTILARGIYVAKRSNLFGNKMNGIKAGLVDGATTCFALLASGAIGYLAVTNGCGIVLSTIFFFGAIAASCAMELANIKDDERTKKN